MAQSLETLVVDLRARTKILERDLDKANRTIAGKMKRQGRVMANDLSAGFTKAFGKLAAITGVTVGFGALQSAIRSTVQESSMLQTTADKLGLTTTALQELRYAGEQFNVSQNTTDMALQRFGRRLAEASQGTGQLKATLDQYNIAVRDTEGNTRGTMDVMRDLADVLHDLEDANEQNRISMQAFDSEGVAFGAVLREGAAGLAKLTTQAHLFGQVIESEQIRKFAELNKQLKNFGGEWRAIKAEFLSQSFNVFEAMGLPTGAENDLRSAQTLIEDITADLNNLQRAGIGEGDSVFDKLSGDLDKYRIQQEAILEDLAQGLHDNREVIGRELANTLANRSVIDEQAKPEHYALLTREINQLNEAQAKLDATEREMLQKYPQMAAYIQQLTLATGGQANATALTAEQMAQFKSIMERTVTPAERLAEELNIMKLAMADMPGRAEEIEERMRRLKADFEESLKPDKMDQLLDTWQDVAEGMSNSLSEALVEGEDALTRSLDRMLKDIQAAALEAAIIAPVLGAFGINQKAGGGFDFGSFFKFGVGKRAAGGPVSEGSPYVVGERGRELFVPGQSGTILPNHLMGSLSGTGGSGGGPIYIEQHLHFDVGLESVDQRILRAAPMIAQATEAQILDRRRRRGLG